MSDPRRQSGLVEARHRVIVADDDELDRARLTTALEEEGYAVTVARHGGELYELLMTSAPGYFRVVIADHQLRGFLGTEVLARAGTRSSFIMVSGSGQPEIEKAAKQLRAAAFFTKPIDLGELLMAVEDIVEATTPEGRRFRG